MTSESRPLSPSNARFNSVPMPLLNWNENAVARVLSEPTLHLRHLYETYGPIVGVNEGDTKYVFAFGPDYNKLVLSNPKLFHTTEADSLPFRSPENSALRRLGLGILSMNGTKHKQQRNLMMSAFHKRRIGIHRDVIISLTKQHLNEWCNDQERDLWDEMRQLTLTLSIKTIFGLNPDQGGEPIRYLLHRFTQALFSISASELPLDPPDSPYHCLMALAEELEVELHTLINNKRAIGANTDDVLSTLIQAVDEDGARMTDAELAAQSLTLFIAGHESTASALSHTLFLLAKHPRKLADLFQELDDTLDGVSPSLEQVESLALLEGAVKESLRLFPPGFWGMRISAEPFEIGPYYLPANVKIIYSPFITHRMTELYTDPNQFLPERWQTIERSPYEYLPFGGGPRMCVGTAFVMLKMKLVLATLLQRYDLALRPGMQADCMKPLSKKTLPLRLFTRDLPA